METKSIPRTITDSFEGVDVKDFSHRDGREVGCARSFGFAQSRLAEGGCPHINLAGNLGGLLDLDYAGHI
jgi:hypothetical protein